MRMQSVLVSLLLCLAILGLSLPGLADSSSPIPADLFDHLLKQGWTEIRPGVMQRSLGGHKVETLGFGAEGLRFQLQQMKAHLVDLRKDSARQPSRQLRIAIRAHRAQILRVEEALKKTQETDELGLLTKGLTAEGASCAVNYDASAFASPIAQGASSSASSYFKNTCGYSGEVYAHTKASATAANGTVTNQTQSDPALDGYTAGANIGASATASVGGVSSCHSYAYASVTNYDLGISYAQQDENFECVANLPAPWVKGDVGAVGLAGSASHANGVFELSAGGTDLAGTADAFHFVHQTLTGDGEIVANLTALLQPGGANFSLAGVMFRNDLTAGSAHATLAITSDSLAKFRRRATAGGSTLSDGPGTSFPPGWIKLVRFGNIFTAYLSADGVTWSQVHTSQVVPMAATVRVGLVVLRNGSTAPAGAARFEGVTVRNLASTPWLNRDSPSGVGDYEQISDFFSEGQMICNGATPISIDCRTTKGVDWRNTGEVYSCDPSVGGVCMNSQQRDGACLDYQVRFLCE